MGQGDQVRRHQGGLKRGRREQFHKSDADGSPSKVFHNFPAPRRPVYSLMGAGKLSAHCLLPRRFPRRALCFAGPSCTGSERDRPRHHVLICQFAARAAKEAATTSSPFVPITLPAAKAS